MKIAIAQLYTNHFDDWANIPIKNKQAYCDKHGYDLVTKRGLYKTSFGDRHPSWHSILLILETLENTNVDWVFWSDIDAFAIGAAPLTRPKEKSSLYSKVKGERNTTRYRKILLACFQLASCQFHAHSCGT